MTTTEIQAIVAEVLVLRNNPQWREDDDHLLATGKVLNSQVGRADIVETAARLRALAPAQMLLQTDLENGSGFVADGTELPPQMALGATGDTQLAYEWGYAVGLEGRRLNVDVTWSPVLDVNLNPENPIINVRAFGEAAELVGRLGAAATRGFIAAGMHPCGKHWPGHGDVAVDSHIELATVRCSRERLEQVEWPPYAAARQAGLESVMTGHLMVPAVDPDCCATVSEKLITGVLRNHLGYQGCIFTDSLGMEGLRRTIDSAQAAWMALRAGHDQVLVDYKRSPLETYEAVLAACLDGRVPLSRLQDAARRVRDLKARRRSLPPLPEAEIIRDRLHRVGRRVAEAAVTSCGELPPGGLDLGARPLLVILDDPKRSDAGIADEIARQKLQDAHPLAREVRRHLPCDVLVCAETPTEADRQRLREHLRTCTAVIGATFAHIQCYKGDGVRLPGPQVELWGEAAASGKLRAMMLFESPYALSGLPGGVPIVVGYGGDPFSVAASTAAVLGSIPCRGTLPVTATRR
jgi:beta-N-acetylhexosaminidase